METYRLQNKKAWEYNAYDFWVTNVGSPSVQAEKILADSKGMLKRYVDYFDNFEGVKIANICGSCGKKAIPLALLGAKVSVFDISVDNERYALEVADFVNVEINYEVCDVLDLDMKKYAESFDVVFMEGGVLHYFHDIDRFMKVMLFSLSYGRRISY